MIRKRFAVLALCALAAAADARTLLYVGNSLGDDVTVIDPATQKVVTTITVGKQVHGVCAPADGKTAYVTVEATHQLQIVDTRTNTRCPVSPTNAPSPMMAIMLPCRCWRRPIPW